MNKTSEHRQHIVNGYIRRKGISQIELANCREKLEMKGGSERTRGRKLPDGYAFNSVGGGKGNVFRMARGVWTSLDCFL